MLADRGEFTPNEYGGRSLHRQVSLKLGGRSAPIDVGLVDLIRELWRANIDTYMSCEKHSVTKKVWLAFSTAADAETFLNAVAGMGGPRERWYFGEYEPVSGPLPLNPVHPAGWEFHATINSWTDDPSDIYTPANNSGRRQSGNDLVVSINVLFPRRHLKRVTEAMRAFNDAR